MTIVVKGDGLSLGEAALFCGEGEGGVGEGGWDERRLVADAGLQFGGLAGLVCRVVDPVEVAELYGFVPEGGGGEVLGDNDAVVFDVFFDDVIW